MCISIHPKVMFFYYFFRSNVYLTPYSKFVQCEDEAHFHRTPHNPYLVI